MPLIFQLTLRSCVREHATNLATWRNGYAAACKAVYTGSIPVVAFEVLTRTISPMLGIGRTGHDREVAPLAPKPCASTISHDSVLQWMLAEKTS